MRVAYADPPYLNCGKKHYGKEHPEAAVWDTLEAHKELADRLVLEFDAFALSASSPSLIHLLPMFAGVEGLRVAAWVKPFVALTRGEKPDYAWEPVIYRPRRPRAEGAPNARDWTAVNITLRKGLVGAKPPAFCYWLFELLGLDPADEFVDLFPGTGVAGRCWDAYRGKVTIQEGLFQPTIEGATE